MREPVLHPLGNPSPEASPKPFSTFQCTDFTKAFKRVLGEFVANDIFCGKHHFDMENYFGLLLSDFKTSSIQFFFRPGRQQLGLSSKRFDRIHVRHVKDRAVQVLLGGVLDLELKRQ